jgi:hypothetical protein
LSTTNSENKRTEQVLRGAGGKGGCGPKMCTHVSKCKNDKIKKETLGMDFNKNGISSYLKLFSKIRFSHRPHDRENLHRRITLVEVDLTDKNNNIWKHKTTSKFSRTTNYVSVCIKNILCLKQ